MIFFFGPFCLTEVWIGFFRVFKRQEEVSEAVNFSSGCLVEDHVPVKDVSICGDYVDDVSIFERLSHFPIEIAVDFARTISNEALAQTFAIFEVFRFVFVYYYGFQVDVLHSWF